MPTVIHTYTRAQAIEDGVLIDVSEMAREAGFRWPVAVTATDVVYPRYGLTSSPPGSLRRKGSRQRACPERSRRGDCGPALSAAEWDTLWMAATSTKLSAGLAARRASTGTTQVTFEVAYTQKPGRGPETVSLKMVAGPGDEDEPVMTIMLPGED